MWSVAVTPDGRQVVSGSQDETIKVWDLETGEEVRTMRGHADSAESVVVTRICRVSGPLGPSESFRTNRPNTDRGSPCFDSCSVQLAAFSWRFYSQRPVAHSGRTVQLYLTLVAAGVGLSFQAPWLAKMYNPAYHSCEQNIRNERSSEGSRARKSNYKSPFDHVGCLLP